VDGQAAVAPEYANDGRCIEILLEPAAAPGQELVITIDYALQSPKSGLHFFGPTVDDPDAPWQVWSQGETSDNRYWIPCFDEPNERQSTEIVATVDASCQVLSTGGWPRDTRPGRMSAWFITGCRSRRTRRT
jgi:aminopeptidase N